MLRISSNFSSMPFTPTSRSFCSRASRPPSIPTPSSTALIPPSAQKKEHKYREYTRSAATLFVLVGISVFTSTLAVKVLKSQMPEENIERIRTGWSVQEDLVLKNMLANWVNETTSKKMFNEDSAEFNLLIKTYSSLKNEDSLIKTVANKFSLKVICYKEGHRVYLWVKKEEMERFKQTLKFDLN